MKTIVDIPAKAKQAKNKNYYILRRDAEMPGFENEKGIVYIGSPCAEEGKMDVSNYLFSYYKYIRPQEENEFYMKYQKQQEERERWAEEERKQRGNGRRHLRVAASYVFEKLLKECGALDILKDVYGENLASRIIELSAFALIHGVGPIDYSELTWDYYGSFKHWYMDGYLASKTFGEIHKKGIQEFMQRFYEASKPAHISAFPLIGQVMYEKFSNDNGWFSVYERHNGEKYSNNYILYFNTETGDPVALEETDFNDIATRDPETYTCLHSSIIKEKPLMYRLPFQLEHEQELPCFTLIPLSSPDFVATFKERKEAVKKAKQLETSRSLHVLCQPYEFKGKKGKLFITFDLEEEQRVMDDPAGVVDNIKNRLNQMGIYAHRDFDSQYCEETEDDYGDIAFRKSKKLTNLLKKEAGYYALFTEDESITESMAVKMLDAELFYARYFFTTLPIENYERTDTEPYEELTGIMLVKFLADLLYQRVQPIIKPFEAQEDPWFCTPFSSALQRLYHPTVDLERGYAKLVDSEYLREDELLEAFGVSTEELEQYAYRLWEIEDYFLEDDSNSFYDE